MQILVEHTKIGPVRYVRETNLDSASAFKSFSYTWRHIPTGKSGISQVGCLNQNDFWALLQRWNCDPQRWVYTACVEQNISEAMARD